MKLAQEKLDKLNQDKIENVDSDPQDNSTRASIPGLSDGSS